MLSKDYQGIEIEQPKAFSSPEAREKRLKEAVINKLVDMNDIPVPEELVEQEVRMMATEYSCRKKYESMASGDSYDFMFEDKTELMEGFRAEAVRLLKTRILIDGIIETENIEISSDELQAEAEAISIRQQMPVEMVTDFLGKNLAPLEKDLLVKKAIDIVYSSAIIK